MRRGLLILTAVSLVMLAPPARAGDDDIIIALAICGVAALGTVGVAGGLAHWENGAANDVRKASNNYRGAPSQASARNVSAARVKWQEAHDFNSEDDTYAWLVGLTGFLGGTMCLGVGAGMLE